MPIPWEGIGIALAAFAAMLGKTMYNGRGRVWVDERVREHSRGVNADDAVISADEAMPDVIDKLETIDTKQDKTYRKVEKVEAKTDSAIYLIQEFHGDEDVSVSVDDILDEDDFYRGGTSDGG